MLGTTGVAVILAPVGNVTRVGLGAASGSVRVSDTVVLGNDATTRLDTVM